MSQELRSLLWDLIPELILSQNVTHTHTQWGPIGNGSVQFSSIQFSLFHSTDPIHGHKEHMDMEIVR